MEAARRLGVDLTVASEEPSTFEASRPDALLTLDFSHPATAAAQARAFAARYPVDGVLGVDDDTVVVAAEIAHALGLAGNSVAAAEAARDKYRQRELMGQHGVPIPWFQLHRLDEDIDALARTVVYPCVVKPLRLSASRGVIRANGPHEFAAAVRRLAAILAQPDAAACADAADAFLVEQYIPGVEVALEGLLTGGALHVLALFDKPDPLEGPFFEETIYATPSQLPEAAQQALGDTAALAGRAIGLTRGPVHAELRWNEKGPWLIELAARPIGGRCSTALRFQDGETLEDVVIREALGLPLGSLMREDRAAGVMMIPVPGAGILREVRGVAEARAVPGIEDVVITAHRGQTMVPWPEGSRYPGFIFARAAESADVVTALRAAHRRLTFVRDRQTD
ncbi:MAG TPA: ATP-grasp domain-containing protein [Gemmatimonadales bacterium]|nr:ATP-grasp domain-containing protein [Gemmatimonadales bacterium]